jgi:hypothetical protein
VVGLDFSAPAIDAARQLPMNSGLPNGRFVQADLYDAPAAIPEAAAFDMYLSRGRDCVVERMSLSSLSTSRRRKEERESSASNARIS